MRTVLVLSTIVILISGCVPTIKPAGSLSGKREKVHTPTSSHINLAILEPKERAGVVKDFPVSVGVVFQKGKLKSAPGGAVEDENGMKIPFEYEVTGWWDKDKSSIKWLLLHFRASTDATYYFNVGETAYDKESGSIAAETPAGIDVRTGSLSVVLKNGGGSLFDKVELNGKAMLNDVASFQLLVLDYGERESGCRVSDWQLRIEENTASRAVVKGVGYFMDRGQRAAKIEVRYQFFKGESFVRIYHTLTWMIKDYKVGAKLIGITLTPNLGDEGEALIGLSDYNGDAARFAWNGKNAILAYQRSASEYTILVDGNKRKSGKHLGGWLEMKNASGSRVGVSLRDAWQMFPTALGVEHGKIQIEFWPGASKRMGFEYRDLIPDNFYYADDWKRYPWSKKVGHAVPEWERNPYWLHTAEGAAITHELVISFGNKSSGRETAELNSLNQHPLVVRQDPKSAMKVPFMGYEIPPVDKMRYPHIEESIDTMGCLSLMRWPGLNDYGFWRYGMMRWGAPNKDLYRWIDGVQYDQQLIPWMLYIRGGDRNFFEDGERTARFAMDVATNHYNTRGVAPGYQAGASCLPFPWLNQHLHKHIKIHFLQYYYHLTGYKRAKEVMDEVIKGAKWAAKTDKRSKTHPAYRERGRELYNVVTLWSNIYEETFDPEVKAYAEEWLDLMLNREYDGKVKQFRSPNVYSYNALMKYDEIWDNSQLTNTVLENMRNLGYGGHPDGGVRGVDTASSACGWAYEKTGDKLFAEEIWDIARNLADLVPVVDFSKKVSSEVPFKGVEYYKHYLLPMLVGLGVAEKLDLRNDKPIDFSDTFIAYAMREKSVGTAYVRPGKSGDLNLSVFLKDRWSGRFPNVIIKVYDEKGISVAETTISGQCRPLLECVKRRFYPIDFTITKGELTIPDAKAGHTYKLIFGGGSSSTTALILTKAQVVFNLPLGQPVDFQNLAGQYYSGGRIFTKTTKKFITIKYGHRYPFSIRDAKTWELIYQTPLPVPETAKINIGENREIAIVVRGRTDIMTFIDGVEPWFSTTAEGWFVPQKESLWKN